MKVNSVGATVEALEQQGVQVIFYHYRWVSDESKDGPWALRRYFRNGRENPDQRPVHVSPVGGMTFCRLMKEGMKSYGAVVFERSVTNDPLAFSPRPFQLETKRCQFCYALGRAVALGRARQQMNADPTDFETMDEQAMLTYQANAGGLGDAVILARARAQR